MIPGALDTRQGHAGPPEADRPREGHLRRGDHPMSTGPVSSPGGGPGPDDLYRYLEASTTLESSRAQVEVLEHSEPVESFNQQLDLLKRRLLTEPRAFRELFIADGMAAIAWEFQQAELGAEFTRTLWRLLLRDDDMSTILHALHLGRAAGQVQAQVHARDRHASVRPLPDVQGPVAGLARARTASRPTSATPEERANDFDLVNQGYLGYMEPRLHRRARSTCSSGSRCCATSSARRGRASSASSSRSTQSPRAAARSRSTSPRCSTCSARATSARRWS